MKINVSTKITINGRQYSSVDEMPPDVRQLYERTMAANAGVRTSFSADLMPPGSDTSFVHQTITFNGRQYASLDDMPPNEREIYRQAMKLAGASVLRSSKTRVIITQAAIVILLLLLLLAWLASHGHSIKLPW